MKWQDHAKWIAALGAFSWMSADSTKAYACSASQTEVYKSAKTVWCVENSVISKYGPFPKSYFAFGDNVIDELAMLFKVPPDGVYTFEASTPSGGAHTGSECCGLGVTVSGDAFYNDAYGATGFWGYLLALHETINDWTGQVSNGWPTDFWADHVSAFPNSMDWHIMETLGAKDNDPNLTKAADGQKKRFYPGGDSQDLRVGMFDQIFALPNYGYDGLSRVFGYVQKDKLSWEDLGVPNPDPKRTEYVIAYLSLGAGKPVTSIMRAAHVGDGKDDGAGDKGYTVDDGHIDAIASAHCAIAAAEAQGGNVAADRKALQSGDFAGVKAAGKCGTGCPTECGCKTASNTCLAPWLGDAPTIDQDGGTSGTSNGADGGKSTGNGASGGGTDAQSGCSCNSVGSRGEGSRLLSLLGASAMALALLRIRGRRR